MDGPGGRFDLFSAQKYNYSADLKRDLARVSGSRLLAGHYWCFCNKRVLAAVGWVMKPEKVGI